MDTIRFDAEDVRFCGILSTDLEPYLSDKSEVCDGTLELDRFEGEAVRSFLKIMADLDRDDANPSFFSSKEKKIFEIFINRISAHDSKYPLKTFLENPYWPTEDRLKIAVYTTVGDLIGGNIDLEIKTKPPINPNVRYEDGSKITHTRMRDSGVELSNELSDLNLSVLDMWFFLPHMKGKYVPIKVVYIGNKNGQAFFATCSHLYNLNAARQLYLFFGKYVSFDKINVWYDSPSLLHDLLIFSVSEEIVSSFLQVETPLPRPAPLFEGTVDGEEPAVIIGGDESGKNAFYFGKFNREGDKFVYITTCATGGDSGGPLFLRNTEGKLGLAGVLKGQDFVEGNAGYTKFVDFAKEIFDGKITEPKKIIELSSGNKRGEALSLGLQAEGGVMYGFVKNEVTFPVSLNGSLDLIDSYYGDTFSAALNLKFQTDWQMIFSGLGVSCAFPLQGGNDFKQHIILDAYAGINFEGGMVYDAFLGYEFAPDSAPSSRLEMFLRLGAYGIYFQEKMYDDFSYDIKGMLTAGIRLF